MRPLLQPALLASLCLGAVAGSPDNASNASGLQQPEPDPSDPGPDAAAAGELWSGFCTWGAWGDWTGCICGTDGRACRQRSRTVLWRAPFADCDQPELTNESVYGCSLQCAPTGVPVDCTWQAWQSWSPCTSVDGHTSRTRQRGVFQQASFGGAACQGAAVETEECAAGWTQAYSAILAIAAASVLAAATGLLLCLCRARLHRGLVLRIVDEEDAGAGAVDPAWCESLPPYWTNCNSVDEGFQEMVYISASQHDKFNELLAATYQARCTQDRPCPNGTCPKTQLGCPCVQLDGSPGLPVGYKVRRVVRVESAARWRRYAAKRAAIEAARNGDEESPLRRFDPPLRSEETVSRYPEVFAALVGEANEAYALHGTSVRAALSIAREDYRLDLAGAAGGTMYGSGCYMAESCTKADEYARDEKGGCYDGLFAMVLARVCMGKFYYTTRREDTAQSLVAEGEFDSTLGDRERSAGTFRELVVYSTEQVYPEYVLLYQRVHRHDDPLRVARMSSQPCHLELPIYWRNCHRNSREEPFLEQYRVRRGTVRLLQNLVDKCLKESSSSWHVVRARRVENSMLWAAYSEFKAGLRLRLGAKDSDEESHGDATDSGGALNRLLRSRSFAEQVLSIDHVDHAANERVLWHGTTKAASECIAIRHFAIPKLHEVENGKRFGRGIYFAESLEKSLSYATEEGGLRFVLLCRVACGEMRYTELLEDPRADVHAMEAGQDSVLACPGGIGPLEVVALRPVQAYPEYLVELSRAPPPTQYGARMVEPMPTSGPSQWRPQEASNAPSAHVPGSVCSVSE